MIAFEIRLNGQRLCLAGADDLTVLHAAVVATGLLGSKGWHGPTVGEAREDTALNLHLDLQVGGITRRGLGVEDSHLGWCRGVNIGVGDTVTVRIVDGDAAQIDQPTEHQPTDAFTSDNIERRQFERAKKTYLALREKYGDGAV